MSTDLLATRDWLNIVEKEYLGSFIRDGGAITKVAVVPEGQEGAVTTALSEIGRQHGFLTTLVGADVDRVYYMDKLFHAVARQIDWDGLAGSFMEQRLSEHFQAPPGTRTLQQLAGQHQVDPAALRMDLRELLAKEVQQDSWLAPDFRTAVIHLCRAISDPSDFQTGQANLSKAWLCGETVGLGALRELFISQRVNRYNARQMLSSCTRFVHRSGWSGLTVSVDVTRFGLSKPWTEPDGTVRRPPTKLAATDTYELMRQCIDGTDEARGLFIAFLASPAFLDDGARGLNLYPALKGRLTDDVRDRTRPNPLAPMVSLN
ncbi:MAG: BREX system ATP-binding domain-containing protein [Candidatus Dormibacteria bacterium]